MWQHFPISGISVTDIKQTVYKHHKLYGIVTSVFNGFSTTLTTIQFEWTRFVYNNNRPSVGVME